MAMLFFEHGEGTRKECGYSYGTESLRNRTASILWEEDGMNPGEAGSDS